MDNSSSIVDQIKSVSKKVSEEIIGIFLVHLNDWNIESFIPILVVTKKNLHIFLKDKSSKIALKDIDELKLNKAKLVLKMAKDELSLSLVNIGGDYKVASEKYTAGFKEFLEKLISTQTVDFKILESLPNQISTGVTSTKGLVILIVGLLFVTISFLIQVAFPTIGWFLLFSGLIMSIFGIVYKVFGKN